MSSMRKFIKIDLASTGGARGGKLALDVAAQTQSPATARVADMLSSWPEEPGSLLPLLHAVQDALGYIPPEAVPMIAAALQRSRAEVHGVITFYPHFRMQPLVGRHLEICRAEACQARGANQLIEHACTQMGLVMGDTDPAGRVSTGAVYCLGLCAQGPAVMLDGQPHAHVTPARLAELLAPPARAEVA